MRQVTTNTEWENGYYPCLSTLWTETREGMEWRGETTLWQDGSTPAEGCTHRLVLTQSVPLGTLTVICDEVGCGCWASGSFPGVGITERDLQWAAEWAKQAIKGKHRCFPCGEGTSDG